MRTFAKVVGASFGMVALLFAVVATALYWNDSAPAPEPPLAAEPPAVIEPPAPASAPKRPAPRRLVLEEPKPVVEGEAALEAAPAAKAAPAAAEKEAEKMSTEEYVAREMHYIGKIQQDADAVLARAASDREKKARLEAELDALESP